MSGTPTERKHHVAVDLDGTLARYTSWQGIAHIGEPIPEVVERVKALLDAGHQVSVFTSRLAGDWPEHIEDLPATRHHIECWCYRNIGRILPVTATKHGWFTEFWDDKSLGIAANQGRSVITREAWAEGERMWYDTLKAKLDSEMSILKLTAKSPNDASAQLELPGV